MSRSHAASLVQEFEDTALARYSRQLLLPEWGFEAQERLAGSHVLVVGMGGLGCPAAHHMLRAGVGRLTLIDGDHVDESNLQRQSLFWPTDLGQPKASAAAHRLQALALPHQQIHAIHVMADESLLLNQLPPKSTVNLVLDCTDQFATRDLINRLCVTTQTPLLSAAAIGLSGQLLFVRPEGACYHCVFGGHDDDPRRCADSGVLATTPATVGALQAHLALRWLGQGIDELDGQLLLWQGALQRLVRVARDPHCTVCSSSSQSTNA